MLIIAVREEGPNGSQGGGAILLVIKGTAHHTFTDVVPYFQTRFSWLIRLVSWTTLYMLCRQLLRRLDFSIFCTRDPQFVCRRQLPARGGSCALCDMANHRPSFFLALSASPFSNCAVVRSDPGFCVLCSLVSQMI